MYTLNGRNPTETPEYSWEEQSNRGRAAGIDYIVVEAGTLFGTARPSFALAKYQTVNVNSMQRSRFCCAFKTCWHTPGHAMWPGVTF